MTTSPAAADDWRRMGQEADLSPGTKLTRKHYRSHSETWEHDHCAFCFVKFMDPNFSDGHREFMEKHPEVLTEGYTTTSEHPRGEDYSWVCEKCVQDFSGEFEWLVIEG